MAPSSSNPRAYSLASLSSEEELPSPEDLVASLSQSTNGARSRKGKGKAKDNGYDTFSDLDASPPPSGTRRVGPPGNGQPTSSSKYTPPFPPTSNRTPTSKASPSSRRVVLGNGSGARRQSGSGSGVAIGQTAPSSSASSQMDGNVTDPIDLLDSDDEPQPPPSSSKTRPLSFPHNQNKPSEMARPVPLGSRHKRKYGERGSPESTGEDAVAGNLGGTVGRVSGRSHARKSARKSTGHVAPRQFALPPSLPSIPAATIPTWSGELLDLCSPEPESPKATIQAQQEGESYLMANFNDLSSNPMDMDPDLNLGGQNAEAGPSLSGDFNSTINAQNIPDRPIQFKRPSWAAEESFEPDLEPESEPEVGLSLSSFRDRPPPKLHPVLKIAAKARESRGLGPKGTRRRLAKRQMAEGNVSRVSGGTPTAGSFQADHHVAAQPFEAIEDIEAVAAGPVDSQSDLHPGSPVFAAPVMDEPQVTTAINLPISQIGSGSDRAPAQEQPSPTLSSVPIVVVRKTTWAYASDSEDGDIELNANEEEEEEDEADEPINVFEHAELPTLDSVDAAIPAPSIAHANPMRQPGLGLESGPAARLVKEEVPSLADADRDLRAGNGLVQGHGNTQSAHHRVKQEPGGMQAMARAARARSILDMTDVRSVISIGSSVEPEVIAAPAPAAAAGQVASRMAAADNLPQTITQLTAIQKSLEARQPAQPDQGRVVERPRALEPGPVENDLRTAARITNMQEYGQLVRQKRITRNDAKIGGSEDDLSVLDDDSTSITERQRIWRCQYSPDHVTKRDIDSILSVPKVTTLGINKPVPMREVDPVRSIQDLIAFEPPGQAAAIPPEMSYLKFGEVLLDEINNLAAGGQNTALIRQIMETYFHRQSLNPHARALRIVNPIDDTVPPPEFVYSDVMFCAEDIDPPIPSKGCGCIGSCKENSDCFCLKRQEAYFSSMWEGQSHTGFAMDEHGIVKDSQFPAFECSDACECPPSCRNRVIQKGRPSHLELEIYKTRKKGWGIRTKQFITSGTFIGIYTGELINDAQAEIRGQVYSGGPTYLFDLDQFHIANPPAALEQLDKEESARAQRAARELQEGDESSFFTVDAFHWGNFTRYINHSCDPNVRLMPAYYDDFDVRKPRLAMVAIRDVPKNGELSISYSGEADDDGVPTERIAVTAQANAKKRKGKAGRKANGSVSTTVDREVACFCDTDRCKGYMFQVHSRSQQPMP